ncbi:MAG: hypothetical protein ABSC24_02150 [Verrucomicrobiota bacterium]
MSLVFTVRAGDNGTTGRETTAKGHQLANSDDNVLVEELAGGFGFFVIRQGVVKRHEQTEAGRVNVPAGDDLLFYKSLYGYRGRPPTTAEQQLRKRLHELSLEEFAARSVSA